MKTVMQSANNNTRRSNKKFLVIGMLLAAVILVSSIYIGFQLKKRNGVSVPVNITQTDSVTRRAASPQDGKGTAVVIPDQDATVSSHGTWKLIFTVAETGIAKGGGVAFHISPFWGWTPPQNYSPAMPGYVTAACSKKNARIQVVTNRQNSYIVVRTEKTELSADDTITIIYGDTQDGQYPQAQAQVDRYAEHQERFFVKVDGDGDGHFFAINQHPSINIIAGPPSRLIVSAPSLVATDAPFTVTVAAVDRMDNWVQSYRGNPAITSSPENAHFAPMQGDHRIASFTCTIPHEGTYQLFARDKHNKISGASHPVIADKQLPDLNIFWGDLHGHSRLSDGTGTPEDYFQYARFVAGLDAAALTDHDAWGFDALDEHPQIWPFIKETTNRFHIPHTFVTFIGYEWTNWTYGHKHVLFLDEPAPLYSYRNPESDSPDKLWGLLKSCNAITISHHIGGGPIGTDWNFYDAEMEPVVEVCSIHGNSEFLGCPASIYKPQEGSFLRDALARGYTLGIIASGDTHNGHPGQGEPLAATGGVMAFYAEQLTREALWDALKKRRVYGTSGARIIVDFKINGKWMGTIARAADNVKRELYLKVTGTDKLQQVEIIKNNASLKIWEENTSSCEHLFTDNTTSAKGDFYYLRIVQADKHIAWSSPVWFK